jgi:hypothetical protein
MEPSSTPFCAAAALSAIIVLTSLAVPEPALARGFAGMGRVHAVHIVPRAPVRAAMVNRNSVNRQFAGAPRAASIQHRSHRRLFPGAGFSGPYGYPYVFDTGQPDAPEVAAGGYGFEPQDVPYDRPACVRPLIIQIKPVKHATHSPRVIYGRPPIC